MGLTGCLSPIPQGFRCFWGYVIVLVHSVRVPTFDYPALEGRTINGLGGAIHLLRWLVSRERVDLAVTAFSSYSMDA